MRINPIKTKYKGYRFRSRLEARWAVFFDALGIKWEYEKEGYDLEGEYYLPDFWLPTFNGGMWAEVKPEDITKEEERKARLLCNGTSFPMWLCIGIPDTCVYRVLWPESVKHDEFDLGDGPVVELVGIPNADQARNEDRMFWLPGYEDDDGFVREPYLDCLGRHYLDAVEKARGSRFEYGESGA